MELWTGVIGIAGTLLGGVLGIAGTLMQTRRLAEQQQRAAAEAAASRYMVAVHLLHLRWRAFSTTRVTLLNSWPKVWQARRLIERSFGSVMEAYAPLVCSASLPIVEAADRLMDGAVAAVRATASGRERTESDTTIEVELGAASLAFRNEVRREHGLDPIARAERKGPTGAAP